MEAHLEKRARRLVDILESAGPSCRLIVIKGAVVIHCPGTPFADLPTIYDEVDVKGLNRKQRFDMNKNGLEITAKSVGTKTETQAGTSTEAAAG